MAQGEGPEFKPQYLKKKKKKGDIQGSSTDSANEWFPEYS
jgi:hypothetical protein